MAQLPIDTISKLLKVIPGLMIEEQDARPLMPAVFNVGVELPFELQPRAQDLNPNRQSFAAPIFVNIVASQAATSTEIARLGAGLWHLSFSWSIRADYVPGSQFSINLERNSDNVIIILNQQSIFGANNQNFLQFDFPLLIRESHGITVTTPATGVGQNNYTRGGVICNRIL